MYFSKEYFKYLTDDPDNNLYVTPTRVYHSGVGRFLQRDPATGFAGGYTYANNAPTNYVDVNGKEPRKKDISLKIKELERKFCRKLTDVEILQLLGEVSAVNGIEDELKIAYAERSIPAQHRALLELLDMKMTDYLYCQKLLAHVNKVIKTRHSFYWADASSVHKSLDLNPEQNMMQILMGIESASTLQYISDLSAAKDLRGRLQERVKYLAKELGTVRRSLQLQKENVNFLMSMPHVQLGLAFASELDKRMKVYHQFATLGGKRKNPTDFQRTIAMINTQFYFFGKLVGSTQAAEAIVGRTPFRDNLEFSERLELGIDSVFQAMLTREILNVFKPSILRSSDVITDWGYKRSALVEKREAILKARFEGVKALKATNPTLRSKDAYELLKVTRSPLFKQRAAALGVTQKELALFEQNLMKMQVEGKIVFHKGFGGKITTEGITIGERNLLSSRYEKMSHEFGHLLKETIDPGGLQASSEGNIFWNSYPWKDFYKHEYFAYYMQSGRSRPIISAFSASAQKSKVGTWAVLFGTALGVGYKHKEDISEVLWNLLMEQSK